MKSKNCEEFDFLCQHSYEKRKETKVEKYSHLIS